MQGGKDINRRLEGNKQKKKQDSPPPSSLKNTYGMQLMEEAVVSKITALKLFIFHNI